MPTKRPAPKGVDSEEISGEISVKFSGVTIPKGLKG